MILVVVRVVDEVALYLNQQLFTAGGVSKIRQSSDEFLMVIVCSSRQPSVGRSDAFEDFRCLNSYPLDQVGSGKFLEGRFMIG